MSQRTSVFSQRSTPASRHLVEPDAGRDSGWEPYLPDVVAEPLTPVGVVIVDVDPGGVLRRLHVLLGNGERWGLSADSLTENHLMPTVSHLLAAHRDLLMSDAQARADLVGALSTFSRTGSPSA